MPLTIEQECPQCGGPVELGETDRLIECPFCSVKNYLGTPDVFRYILPARNPERQLIYVPYLHFKGNVFLCHGNSINYRFVETTALGTDHTQLPSSQGVRTQALKMQFATPAANRSYLQPTRKLSTIVSRAGKLQNILKATPVFHRAIIGEAVNLIYSPIYIENSQIHDAIIDRPICRLNDDSDIFSSCRANSYRWRPVFMPTLCPNCGWNLDGERDSVVLTCTNCNTAWEASENNFRQISFSIVPGQGRDIRHLPFWRIQVSTRGIDLDSYADLMRITNQPKVIRKEWENIPLEFWIPAFKIRPRVYLNTAARLTITRPFAGKKERLPPANQLHPVTLPQKEAHQSLKIVFGETILSQKNFLPILAGMEFNALAASLAYLPFRVGSHELILDSIGLGINRKALQYGRTL